MSYGVPDDWDRPVTPEESDAAWAALRSECGDDSPLVQGYLYELRSRIISTFNDMFGNLDWNGSDRVAQMVVEDIPSRVAGDPTYTNAIRDSDRENARIEHDKALEKAVVGLLADYTELFKQFSENESFRKWVADSVFKLTYTGASANSPRSISDG